MAIDSPTALHTVAVDLGAASYPILIGRGGLAELGERLLERGFKRNTRLLLVSNADVAGPYGPGLERSLHQAGFLVESLVIPAGEAEKTPASIALIHDAAYAHQLERGSLIVALGGGVVGDMAGFAAATWLRGIAVAQVPTTLLAMVDAAIGGKTGVNHPGGKNLIGAFHQPRLVLVDPDTLETLPEREFRAGLAEVIKYGVIGDPVLFEALEAKGELHSLGAVGPSLLLQILKRSASAKARVVAADEREGNLRAILNYGHTLGHVVETLSGYSQFLHGEAVAIGMAAAGWLSLELGLWTRADHERQLQLIRQAGLPIASPSFAAEAVQQCLLRDKKVRDGRVRFVLPTGIGAVVIRDDVAIGAAIEALRATSRGN